MAPMHSTRDKSTITAAMEVGELFPNVRDRVVRASILDRILRVRGRILSLFSFFEDTKYLETVRDHHERASSKRGELLGRASVQEAIRAISS
jgi:hypothetical protein